MKAKLLALAAIFIALALYFSLRQDRPPNAQPPAPGYIAAEGKLEARPGAKMEVGSELTARMASYLVKVGDHVAKGQVIALLDVRDMAARLAQAEAELKVAQARRTEVAAGARDEEIKQAQAILQRMQSEQALAEKEFERIGQLHRDKFVSQARLDHAESALRVSVAKVSEAGESLALLRLGPRRETLALHEAQVAQAEASLRHMRALLDKARVVSPISGILIERYLDVGEVAMPEKPVAFIADTAQLRINAEVDETDAGRLHLGDSVEIRAYAYPGAVYQGRIEEIAHYVGKREIRPNNPAVNLGLKIIQVKIALLEAAPLKLGMTVDVRIMPASK